MRTETIELDRASRSRAAARATNPSPGSPPPSAATAADPPERAPAAESAPADTAAASAEASNDAPADERGAGAPPAGTAEADAQPVTPAAKTGTEAPPADAKPASPSPPAATQPRGDAPASASPREAEEGWAVQVGTFASSSNATALAATLKARGYPAFVAPVASGGKTLYRVRVGPTADIESARALERRLEKETPAADVVRQP
jgi:cell division septation protein DedD